MLCVYSNTFFSSEPETWAPLKFLITGMTYHAGLTIFDGIKYYKNVSLDMSFRYFWQIQLFV